MGLLIPLIILSKDKELSIWLLFKNNLLFILAIIVGFFYPIIAQLYISYSFLSNLTVLYTQISNKKEQKSRLDFYFLAGAVLITSLYNYYNGSVSNSIKSETDYPVEVISDEPPATP